MFEFHNELEQADYLEFSTKTIAVYEKDVKPVLREPPTSDVPSMLRKLEFLAGWVPYFATQRAKAERFLKLAKAQALSDCPVEKPELKVKIWLEGEIADVEYLFNHLHAVYSAAKESAMMIQTCVNVEVELQNLKTYARKENR